MKILLERHGYTLVNIQPWMLTDELRERLTAVNEDNMFDLATDIVDECSDRYDCDDCYDLYETVVQVEADNGNTYWETIGE